jgi:hypothetical protein
VPLPEKKVFLSASEPELVLFSGKETNKSDILNPLQVGRTFGNAFAGE